MRVDGELVGEIGSGLLVLVGFGTGDGEEEIAWMARKLWELRIFADAEGRMNLSAEEEGAALLIVSQFTLYGDASKGRRPSFTGAAAPDVAEGLYEGFVAACRRGGDVAVGRFGAMMSVELVNDGPVTLILER